MATRLKLLEQPEQIFNIHSGYSSLMTSKTGKYVKQGYILIRTSEGWIREHRLVWEEYHKACLLPWAHVHHINGNRADNRIENLEAMTINDHSKIHFDPANTKGKHWKWKEHVRGRRMTEEHRKNISKALKGKRKSDEHRKKLGESIKGRIPWNKGRRLKA